MKKNSKRQSQAKHFGYLFDEKKIVKDPLDESFDVDSIDQINKNKKKAKKSKIIEIKSEFNSETSENSFINKNKKKGRKKIQNPKLIIEVEKK